MMGPWITIEDVHINLGQIRGVYYCQEDQYVNLHDGTEKPYTFYDPDQKIYNRICSLVGVEPIVKENIEMKKGA